MPWTLSEGERDGYAVSKVTKTLDRVLRGNADANIRFGDLCALLHHLSFDERIQRREGFDQNGGAR